ncbi:MAG TPA: ASPIC/UnbV domain-containing protein, partial [Planctomycetia bacterium]|nr:ASPIC/UnbV domain-containing protein [Planctomycetia bacterium]
LRLVDPALGGRDALGAKAIVTADGFRRCATLQTATSYLSASEAAIRLGLGESKGPIRVEVSWPDGDPTPEVFEDVAADRLVTLRRGRRRE